MRNAARRGTAGAALLVAVALASAGCGGSSSSTPAPPTSTTTTTTTATTTTSEASTAATTTTPSSTTNSSTTTTSPSTTTPASGATAVGRCLDFAGAASKLGSAFSQTASGTPSSGDLKTYFAALAAKAPDSIKASFETLATAYGAYLDEVKSLNIKPGETPSADTIQKLEQAATKFRSADVQKANKDIQTWVSAGCK